MNVVFCCPSYKRTKVKTLEYIPFCRIYVDGKEYDEYKCENKNADIVKCEDGIQGNLCRVRNYILRSEFSGGADAVVIVDDDMNAMHLWVGDERNHTIHKKLLQTEELKDFFEKYSYVCEEMGYKFWGGSCNQDKMTYSTHIPFNTNRYIGGPLQVFLKGNECFYDERLPLKEDYDMTLQQCNRYRGCLRLNFLTYDVKQSEQAGGCASYRTMMREKEQFELLRKKWGGDIVREDKTNKGRSEKMKRFDYNPIICVPIKGV